MELLISLLYLYNKLTKKKIRIVAGSLTHARKVGFS